MSAAAAVVGSSPGQSTGDKIKVAGLRALRTLLQGVAGSFGSAAIGPALLSTSYWSAFAFSCIAALVAAAASFLQNVASFLPTDPTQAPPPARGATGTEPVPPGGMAPRSGV